MSDSPSDRPPDTGADVWDGLVGQEDVVALLRRAVDAAGAGPRQAVGAGMTHAWLFTGSPGSGRSTAARAFAAALECERRGCGQCLSCRTAIAGTHADVETISTRLLSIGVDDTRALVERAARYPVGGRWQVVLMEDADRLTEPAANALLKAIEEPTPRTVWLLCAPSLEDVLPTIRSRCRQVSLRTPPADAVTDMLTRRERIDPAMAAFAARASQGHIGRARRLATDERARLRRSSVLEIPMALTSLGACIHVAADLADAAAEEAKVESAEVDAQETEELSRALGAGTVGRRLSAAAASALKDLERQQKRRAVRTTRDAMDRSLVDLASFYRDVLVRQLGAEVGLVNEELRPAIDRLAAASTPEQTLRRIEAVLACREAVDANVALLLAAEAMTLALRAG